MDLKVNITVTQNGRRAPKFDIIGGVGADLFGRVTLEDLFAFTKAALIITADTVLKEEQANGFDKSPVIVVDGVIGRSVADVNPLGKIEIVARADMSDIILFTYQGLVDRSPFLTGRYRESNFVFWNGQQVATDLPSLKSWLDSNPEFGDKDLVRFVNIQPYARKLERQGVTFQRTKTRTPLARNKKRAAQGLRTTEANGTYFLTSRAVRAKYKRNSVIKFEFISGTQLGIAGNFVPRRGKPGRAYLYPSILISVSESGVL